MQVTEELQHISGEAGLLRYLAALRGAPSSPHFKVPTTKRCRQNVEGTCGFPTQPTRGVNSAGQQPVSPSGRSATCETILLSCCDSVQRVAHAADNTPDDSCIVVVPSAGGSGAA